MRPILAATGRDPTRPQGRARNVIQIWLNGGPSQLETFDMKPTTAFAGAFRPIATSVDGIQFSEHLPQLARRAHRLAILRSMTVPTADHVRACELGFTGHLPSETIDHPWILCSAAAETAPTESELPSIVSIGVPHAGAGFLGPAVEPFVVLEPEGAAQPLRTPDQMAAGRISARMELLDRMDRRFAEHSDPLRLRPMQSAWSRARAITGSRVADAFDIALEPPARAAPYGAGRIGRSCLLARRLIEHGVRYVGVRSDGWDTHIDNFDEHRILLGDLDPALSALIDDLEQAGLLQSTVVVACGEFGRTPEINMTSGRDHQWRCFSAVVAGGGLRVGQVIGASDETGHRVVQRPVTVPELHATIHAALGLDPGRVFVTPEGRPIPRLDSARPIPELVG